MNSMKKEIVVLAVVVVVAIIGLLQLFHEEAYAIPECSASRCPPFTNCSALCVCVSLGFTTTCDDCLHNCR